jgi:photosynthetic reaction center cytochrome c subunit
MSARHYWLRLTVVLGFAALAAGCERPPVDTVQRGYRGLAMVEVYNPRIVAREVAANRAPEPLAPAPAGTPAADSVYKNIHVLNDLSVAELARLMVAMTNWVAPKEGCPYCHVDGDLASDALYTKVVARRMLQMTRQINTDWKVHVAGTGVTCYTCHRGQPVPANVWFANPGPKVPPGMLGNHAGQNTPARDVGLTSLPYDPFTPFLYQAKDIRVVSTTALPSGDHQSVKQTEWTYALMMHISQALGVNCTYCHNSRSFASWDGSTPQRATAWYGIRMVRELNAGYLEPLKPTFPANRLGALGDVPKINCTTCHQGVYKPLFGAKVLNGYPELAHVAAPAPVPAAGPPPVQDAAAASGDVLAKVLFDTGKKSLGPEALAAIARAVDALKKNAALSVDLSGFADRTGNADQNLELAKERAFAVRDALKAAGVADNRIVLKKPEFAIGGAEADARRVDIIAAK